MDANRKGNTGLGDVDLSTGEGLTDKCASVYTFRLVNKCLPEDSSFLCNVRPKCILKDDNIHCKSCDETECSNIVEHIKVFAEFTDAIKVKLLFLNFGGRTTEKIGAALVEQQIMAKENVLSTGYHMCMLIKRQRSKNWLPAQQQYDVTNFVKKVDTFLTAHFDIESGTILTACINDNRMKFVVEIDEETKLESEASRVKRLEAAKAKANARQKAKRKSMSTPERKARNAKENARQKAKRKADNAKEYAQKKAKRESMSTQEFVQESLRKAT